MRDRQFLRALGRNVESHLSAVYCVEFQQNLRNLGRPRIRRPAGSAAKGEIQGNFARSAEIQRNIRLLGLEVRSCAPHYSAVDRVEISPWGPGKRGCSRTRHQAGSAVKGRDSAICRTICRNSPQAPLTWGERAAFRISRLCGRLRTISSRNAEKSRSPTGQPPGRFCGEGARFVGNSARSAEIQRNRHLLGLKGRNSAPRDTAADCVKISPINPKNSAVRGPSARPFLR